MPENTGYNENELLVRISDGDERAFTVVFNEYWPRVYSAALLLIKNEETAEDVAQDVFAKLWHNRKQATEIQNLKSFLFISARNLIFNKLVRIKVEDAYQNYLRGQFQELSLENEEKLALREWQRRIQEAVSKLPAQQQKVFKLSKEQGMTYEQVATALNISKETVKEHIAKALVNLRRNLLLKTELLIIISRIIF